MLEIRALCEHKSESYDGSTRTALHIHCSCVCVCVCVRACVRACVRVVVVVIVVASKDCDSVFSDN